MKNTIYNQKSKLDQFYTNPNIALMCYNEIWKIYDKNNFDLFLEPSAGNGSFFLLFPDQTRIGLDLEPKHQEIIKQDFFDFIPDDNQKIITIGNPPFGRICSTAIKFFNAAAKYSSVIAFIIPKTFQKQSVQNKLNLNFHLKLSMDLPKNSFIFNDQPYDVPCCFQIWEKSPNERIIPVIDFNNDVFEFTKTKSLANMVIRRVGGNAGKASLNVKGKSSSTHYFLKYKLGKRSINQFIKDINNLDLSKVINATAGVRSLSKSELITALRVGGLI